MVGCKKLKDTEWISRQDPYVFLNYWVFITDGDTKPTFQEKFVYSLIQVLRELNIVVWHSNTLQHDDFIGSGRVQLAKVLSFGYDDSFWPLQTKSGSGVVGQGCQVVVSQIMVGREVDFGRIDFAGVKMGHCSWGVLHHIAGAVWIEAPASYVSAGVRVVVVCNSFPCFLLGEYPQVILELECLEVEFYFSLIGFHWHVFVWSYCNCKLEGQVNAESFIASGILKHSTAMTNSNL
ncbi:elicitor-responsive protein 3 [Artemisia annua]|uniref:Elicitor-responsive protein 3 n=1 Tax=Artemisia annua TaxID=35608 RepID=A0A2U1MMR9_ARTAN|nr:elicitor-responsive protein 3 [Artemisia annua]